MLLAPALQQVQIPDVIDELSEVADWPVYLNDQIGDCTVAAAGHMIEAWTRYGRGTTVEITDIDVVLAYRAVSGYDPARPETDRGAVMQDVLDYWRRVGIGGHKILAFAQVNHHDPAEVATALYLFGHVYVGLKVPRSAEDQFRAGQPWDVVPDDGGIVGGHAVDLGARPYRVVTWGRLQEVTGAFWDRYVEEAWVVADEDWINVNGSCPAGLDTTELNRQFTALTEQPGPFATGDPDAALAAVAAPWVAEHHIGDNRRMATALLAWLTARRFR